MVLAGFQKIGGHRLVIDVLTDSGWSLYHPFVFGIVSVGLSLLVSNVPAVMLLQSLFSSPETPLVFLLALTSTFAGNQLLPGSIANLIVATQAARYGFASRSWITCAGRPPWRSAACL